MFDQMIEKSYYAEDEAAKLFKEVLLSLSYLHNSNIAHRDLKHENFLFRTKDPNSDMKMIDFGLSRILKDRSSSLHTRAGTPYYIAPEVLEGKYTMQCDMWSAGSMLYTMLCGYTPFYGEEKEDIMEMVKSRKYSFDSEEWD